MVFIYLYKKSCNFNILGVLVFRKAYMKFADLIKTLLALKNDDDTIMKIKMNVE